MNALYYYKGVNIQGDSIQRMPLGEHYCQVFDPTKTNGGVYMTIIDKNVSLLDFLCKAVGTVSMNKTYYLHFDPINRVMKLERYGDNWKLSYKGNVVCYPKELIAFVPVATFQLLFQ